MALLAGLAPLAASAATPSDALRARLRPSGDLKVYDFAKILSPADRAALEDRCRTLKEKTGAEFAVVILDSLEGGDIDDFTIKLSQQWGVGKKGKDNGLMLLVALSDRKARLETGSGLEPIIPDAVAGRILDEQLYPAFKQQRYGDGLKAAVNRAAELIERGERASPEARRGGGPPTPLGQKIMGALFLALFVAIGSYTLGTGIGAKVGSLCQFGAIFAGFAYIMGLIGAAPIAPLIHTPVAILLVLLGIRAGRRNPGSFRNSGRKGGSDFNTWSWAGSGSGGSSWSGGGFGGGFSGGFGGGSFGGGGASGGW